VWIGKRPLAQVKRRTTRLHDAAVQASRAKACFATFVAVFVFFVFRRACR
jgi:hypothetical protein